MTFIPHCGFAFRGSIRIFFSRLKINEIYEYPMMINYLVCIRSEKKIDGY